MNTHRRSTTTLRRSVLALLAALVAVTVAPSGAQAASRTIDTSEVTQVRMINRFRAAHHLAPLRIDARLSTSAAWLGRDMGAKGYFSHTDSLHRDAFQRIRAFGYPSANTYRGENIAAGNATVFSTYQQWLNSPPHRANWLVPSYRAIGIARVRVPGSTYGWYWVTDFGSRYVSSPA